MTTLVGRSLVIVVLGLTWLTPASAAVGAVEAGPLVARVQTPDFQLTDNGVEVPTYAANTAPGAPSLPLTGLSFELPLTGDWEVTFESTGSRILAERVAVAAVPVPDLDLNGPVAPQERNDLPGFVPMVDRPDPDIYGVDAFYPASPVVAGKAVVQGGQRILPVRVFPFQYNPVTQQLRYHPDLLVQVQVQRGAEGMTPTAPQAGDFYEPTALPGDGVLRIHTKERGLYQLTYDDLGPMGVDLGKPNTYAIYYKGEQIAIEVTGTGDGSFDDGDLVIFYAVPYDGGRYQDYNIYQFVWGNGVPPNPRRIIPRRVKPLEPAPTIASVITRTLHVENNIDYRSLYPRPSSADHFFDTALSVSSGTRSAVRTYPSSSTSLSLSNLVTSAGNVQIRALIHGGVSTSANPDQSVRLRLNNCDAGTYKWNDMVDHLITATLPVSCLSTEPRQVHLEANLDDVPGLSSYFLSPDWVQVSYPSQAVATGDHLYIEGVAAPATAVAVTGFTESEVLVFDVSVADTPQRLTNIGVEPLSSSDFMLHWVETVANPSYVLSTDEALQAPGAIERTGPPAAWANPDHEYDYIAIVGAERGYNGTTTLGADLMAAVGPLLDYRETPEGGDFRVARVPVQDIYDEWSYGRIDPHAIRSFLSYAYTEWRRNSDDEPPVAEPPGYVLLVGDGHYDYNKARVQQQLPMLLPPYMLSKETGHVDPILGEAPADNLYVSVDSFIDYLPDIAIGRLPVNNAADVTAMVDKILTYEDEDSNPKGPWQQRTVYAAGDCADSAGNFHWFSDQGRLSLPTPYVNDRVYYDNPNNTIWCPDGTHTNATNTDANTLRPAIRDAYDQGAFYMQWFGHGSRTSWGGVASGIAFLRWDPDMLKSKEPNNTQLPLTTAYACWTGYFVWEPTVTPHQQTLAELMVVTPAKGSIADLSPSGLHVGGALLTLQQGMHKKLFEARIERAGDVVDAAKLFFFQNSVGWHDVIDTMILFGDPALKLRYPTGDLSSSTLDVSAAEAPIGATLSYTLTVRNSSIFATAQPLVVVDYPQNLATVVDGGGAVDNGDTLRWTLSDLPPNSQQVVTFILNASAAPLIEGFDLVVPATVNSQMAPDVALEVQTIILAAPDAVVSSLEANRAWLPPGFPLTATLTLSHTGDLPAPGVLVTLTLPAELGAPTWLSTPSLLYDSMAQRITWSGDAPAGAPTTLAFSSAIPPSLATHGDLLIEAAVTYNGVTTPQTFTVSLVLPDVNASGDVTVADIQQIAARWGSLVGSPNYHPRYDLNADDVIDVLDIILAAEVWD